ncbi:NAD-dependent epimerase/dehydratase family protein [Streptomyces sp. NBC_00503]|uniref:NAD-dependent epimerase/dehydratase family protein n=1 Tax=Streptomyces sp. NBC_00503 TaxID=2903659 RepID=UPI002E81AEED|nr:NAD-dependent epimerase/dehydratase family protein [Streptomyces sp. NBC_00503]WUD79490.1 reductase [Streptomyces sp. NBC_00503]
MKKILVIGGSRYFGRRLVTLERDAGNEVTVLNRGSAVPPRGVGHLVADRDDEEQLLAALGERTFDTVYDQVLYTPRQARLARRVFAGRTGRYVMTSTMEVYDPAPPTPEALAYAEGKRQAEAVLAQDPAFAHVAVRTAHVLGGGRAEFTGRLAHYVERIGSGDPVDVHQAPYPTSFIHHHEIARFLHWAGEQSFTGPVNAASHGDLDVLGLGEAVGAAVGRAPRYRIVGSGGGSAAEASPFSFDRAYAMDNSRAAGLGFDFGRVADWLPEAIEETVAEL